jgi:hypothetical protein
MSRFCFRLGLGLLLCAVPVALQARPALASSRVQPVGQGTSRVEITSPAPSAVVRGTILVEGTAIDTDFRYYRLDWAPDPPVGGVWNPIQPPVAQQVRDGVLGLWDTTAVPDGLYLIRLQIIRNDALVPEVQVRVQVANATPTPSPSPTPPPTSTPPPGTATPGPSPTPLIWQPPTRTPRPTEGPGTPTATPSGPDPANSPFRPERLRGASCTGVWITLGVFVSLGLYSLIRTAVRGQLRVAWWRFRRDTLGPLFARWRRDR